MNTILDICSSAVLGVFDEGRVIEAGSYHELRRWEESTFRELAEMQSL